MAESKGPIAEASVSPVSVDRIRRPRSTINIIAPLSSRFLAVLIDMFLIGVVVLPLISISSGMDPLNQVASLSMLWLFAAWGIVLIAYHTVFEGIWGVTLGKWLLQIGVVAEDLGAIGIRSSLVRNVMRCVDALPFIVPYLLGLFAARASRNGQRWGDRLAKTIVINV